MTDINPYSDWNYHVQCKLFPCLPHQKQAGVLLCLMARNLLYFMNDTLNREGYDDQP